MDEYIGTLSININVQNQFYLCSKCNQIPLLKYRKINENENVIIDFNCSCGEKKQLTVKDFFKELSKQEQKEFFCDNYHPKKEKASVYCPSCKLSFCSHCLLEHRKWRPDHEVLNSKMKSQKNCEQHPDKQLHFFCLQETCNKHFCTLCLQEHVNHEYLKIADADNCINIEEIKTQLNKSQNFLEEYTRKMKDDFKRKLNNQIEEVEKAFTNYLDRNRELIKFFNHIYESYLASQSNNFFCIKNLMENANFSLKKLGENPTYEQVLNYLKTQNILVPEIPIKFKVKSVNIVDPTKIQEIDTDFQENDEAVNCICLLDDGRIAAASLDNTIQIYNPFKDFACEITIKAHTDAVKYVTQLRNKKLISASWDGTIKIFSIRQKSFKLEFELKDHTGPVLMVTLLSNNRFASCSNDNSIKIWDANNSYSLIKTLKKEEEGPYISILQLTKKEVLVSGSQSKIAFWNIAKEKYQHHCSLQFSCEGPNSLCQYQEEKILIGSSNVIYLIDTKKYSKIADFKNNNIYFGSVFAFMPLTNGNVIFGTTSGNLYLLTVDSKEVSIIKKEAHKNQINQFISISSRRFASCSNDTEIKFWE